MAPGTAQKITPLVQISSRVKYSSEPLNIRPGVNFSPGTPHRRKKTDTAHCPFIPIRQQQVIFKALKARPATL
jgi:hypothetical protein